MPDITREEVDTKMLRLHGRVDEIRESSIRTEESSKNIEVIVSRLETLMYGNGKDGLMTKISNLFTKVGLNFKLVIFSLTLIVGIPLTMVCIMWKKL